MLRLFNSFSSRQLLALLGLMLVISNQAAAANDFVQFDVNCKGVLADVIDKGYSPLVVGYAVDADGEELSPEAFETYKGTTLRVPVSALKGKKPADMVEAKEKYAAIAAAHEERMERIGRKKYEAAMKKCEESLIPARKFVDFEIQPEMLKLKVGQTAQLTALAVWSDGKYYVTANSTDPEGMTVMREEDRATFTVKGLKPGSYQAILYSEGHERSVDVIVEDLSFFEKLAKYIPAGWSGYALGLGLLLLLALFVGLFLAIRLGWFAAAIAVIATWPLIVKVGMLVLSLILAASAGLYLLLT